MEPTGATVRRGARAASCLMPPSPLWKPLAPSPLWEPLVPPPRCGSL